MKNGRELNVQEEGVDVVQISDEYSLLCSVLCDDFFFLVFQLRFSEIVGECLTMKSVFFLLGKMIHSRE